MIKNDDIYVKYGYLSNGNLGLEESIINELPLEEKNSLSEFQNHAAKFIMENYTENDYLNYFNTDTINIDDVGSIIGVCIGVARSRSIAKRDCNSINNIYHYHTDCSYVGTDCGCLYDDFLCACTSYWDC